MADFAAQILELAEELVPNLSEQSINDIKAKLITLANDLKSKQEIISTSITVHDIDNILNEIEEKDNDILYNTKQNEKESKLQIEWITSALFSATWHPSFHANNLEVEELNKISWIALFMQPESIRKSSSTSKQIYVSPFSLNCSVNEEDLSKIYDDIPDGIKNAENIIIDDNIHYFAEWILSYKTDEKNMNKLLCNKIVDILKKYGCWLKFNDLVKSCNIEKTTEFYKKYKDYIDINSYILNDGETVLHTIAKQKKGEAMISWLLTLKNIKYSQQNYDGETALMIAKSYGEWDIVSKLRFASMSDKMRQKSDEQVSKLNRNKGIIKQWFRFYKVENKNCNEYKSMQKMCETLKILIQQRLPISDDMLLLCFYFELKENNNDPLQCSIWDILYNTLNEILRIPLNRRNWLWFKQYIFGSSLWYQKVKKTNCKIEQVKTDKDEIDNRLLYHLLIEMVSKQLKAQRDFLKPHINKLENNDDGDTKDDNEYWDKLKNYKEFIVTNNPEGLRQDDCMNGSSNKQLLPYPILPLFNDDQLTKLNEKVKEFNCHHHYDVHGYLSKLVLIAHSLNETFHQTMREIFEINPINSMNFEDGVVYSAGPVKRLQRSQGKAETDYSHCSYPTTAKIIDFIRCCLIYNKPQNVLNGINKFMEIVNSGKTCLKKILRLKNMFLDNKRENNNKWDLFKYSDIKMGVLMECNGQSMIVEVQFLLDFMLKAKSLGHGLYEIERNKDFIFDVNEIMNIGTGDDNNIDNLVRSAVISGNENALATLILNEAPLDLTILDKENNKGYIHIASEKGHKKILKLILNTLEADDKTNIATIINQKGGGAQYSPLMYCIINDYPELLKILLKYKELDVNQLNADNETALFKNINNLNEANSKQKQIFNILKEDKRCNYNIKGWNDVTLFMKACDKCDDLEFIQKLWKTGFFKINDVDKNNQTALMRACNSSQSISNTEIVKFLLRINDIDINIICKETGSTAIDFAMLNENIEIINLLYNRKDLLWKCGERNKFVIACSRHNISFCKYILNKWTDIDINGNDGKEEELKTNAVIEACENIDTLNYVLSLNGINADIMDGENFTPWLKVIYNDNIEAAKILWQRKDIDFFRYNDDGEGALELAMENGNDEIIEWLKSNGFQELEEVDDYDDDDDDDDYDEDDEEDEVDEEDEEDIE